ncbi:MAG: phage DNA packaging protein J [Candidatus Rokubacteria bacterium]|nr:phage DNA packaging protein J [Candidatus Rokubacteria bacterium]
MRPARPQPIRGAAQGRAGAGLVRVADAGRLG